MRVGTRIVSVREVEAYAGTDIFQISVYPGMQGSMTFIRRAARRCREAGVAHVLHPVGYSILDTEGLGFLMEAAAEAGEAMILHDETSGDGGRLEGDEAGRYREALSRLSALCRVSLENSAATHDAPWFWRRFASSITLDIGHVESADLDSVEFVRALDDSLLDRMEYVHIHHNAGLRGGITDHWPLREGCRELRALSELLARKDDLAVILEINEREETLRSLGLIRAAPFAGA